MIGRNDLCWCGSGAKWKRCHYPAQPPGERTTDATAERYRKQYGILIKTPEQIAGIRAACRLASDLLEATCAKAVAGTTTAELDAFAVAYHKRHSATAAPFHYGSPPFPKSICTSLNEVICHGIPDATQLRDGDILNVDVTPILNGYFGDCSKMVIVGGHTTPDRQRVCDVAYECLMRSIAILKPGILLSAIGDAISDYAEAHGCSVVTQFSAHGTGLQMHEPPQICHHRNRSKIELVPGMVFTIEPMINAGVPDAVIDPRDQWTARTHDGKPSAQWEHTILITDSGHEVLTCWKR